MLNEASPTVSHETHDVEGSDDDVKSRIPRIALGTPCRDLCDIAFEKCLSDMIGQFCHTYVAAGLAEIVRITDVGSILPDMRNSIVRKAMEEDCTHILWLDSDMIFPPDTLLRLYQHGLPIVGAGYAQRNTPSKPVCAKNGFWVYTEEHSTGLERVDFLGTGCLLTEVEVFRHLPEPWFMLGWNETKKRTVGEDVYFCRKAASIGAYTHIDHDLTKEIGHVGKYVFTYKDFLKDKEILLERQKAEKAKSGELNDDMEIPSSEPDKSAA